MATPWQPNLKNILSEKFRQYIWIPQPRKLYHIRKNFHCIAYRTEICGFLAFLCKFGCYGNSLCSL